MSVYRTVFGWVAEMNKFNQHFVVQATTRGNAVAALQAALIKARDDLYKQAGVAL